MPERMGVNSRGGRGTWGCGFSVPRTPHPHPNPADVDQPTLSSSALRPLMSSYRFHSVVFSSLDFRCLDVVESHASLVFYEPLLCGCFITVFSNGGYALLPGNSSPIPHP